MLATEARATAQEAEEKRLYNLIKQAALEGEYEVRLSESLSDEKTQMLEELGYTVYRDRSWMYATIIKW